MAISHDRIFKEFLDRFLPDFLKLFLPEIADQLDLSEFKLLNRELAASFPHQLHRIADFVAEVATKEGEPEIVLVHIEVEASNKRTLPRRMFEYYSLLRLSQQKPVLPIALVLLPNAGGLCMQQYDERLFGHTTNSFFYFQVGLRDLPAGDYMTQPNAVAQALAILMQYGVFGDATVKLHALRGVGESNLTMGDKLYLMNIINTYLPTTALEEADMLTLDKIESYEMSWLDKTLLQGREEGLEQGYKKTLQAIRLLAKHDIVTVSELTGLSAAQVEEIAAQLASE